MKKGDIVMIYTDPANNELKDGWAKLIRLLEVVGCFELWDVEFLDYPGKEWSRLIKSNA